MPELDVSVWTEHAADALDTAVGSPRVEPPLPSLSDHNQGSPLEQVRSTVTASGAAWRIVKANDYKARPADSGWWAGLAVAHFAVDGHDVR
jgi:hypothetical protein